MGVSQLICSGWESSWGKQEKAVNYRKQSQKNSNHSMLCAAFPENREDMNGIDAPLLGSPGAGAFLLKFYQDRDLRFGDVPLQGTMRVGRSRDNDVVLNHNSVSRFHATFLVEKGDGAPILLLRDEGSRNGCIVNGRPVHGTEVLIKPGDCIQLGVFLVDLSLVSPQPALGAGDETQGDIVFAVPPSNQTALPNQRLRVLYELDSRIEALEGQPLLAAIAASIAETLPFSGIYLSLETESGALQSFACTPDGPCDEAAICVSPGVISKCQDEGVAVLAGGDSPPPGEDPSHDFKPQKSTMCVPFSSSTRSFGVIHASSPAAGVYSKDDLQFLILVASSVTRRLEASRALTVARDEKEKLEKALANLQEAVLLLDNDLRVLHCNAAAERIFGDKNVEGQRIDAAFAGFQMSCEIAAFSELSRFEVFEDSAHVAPDEAGSRLPRLYAGRISRGEPVGTLRWKYVVSLHDLTQTLKLEMPPSWVASTAEPSSAARCSIAE